MEETIEQTLKTQSEKLDAIYTSVEKTRKYFQIVMWVIIAMVVLPALGLLIVIPMFVNTYLSSFEGLL